MSLTIDSLDFWIIVFFGLTLGIVIWWDGAKQSEDSHISAQQHQRDSEALSKSVAELASNSTALHLRDLNTLESKQLKALVPPVAARLRAMGARFHSELADDFAATSFPLEPKISKSAERLLWQRETMQYLERKRRHEEEFHRDLLPETRALFEEFIRRVGKIRDVRDEALHGMLAGPYALEHAALTLETYARKLRDND